MMRPPAACEGLLEVRASAGQIAFADSLTSRIIGVLLRCVASAGTDAAATKLQMKQAGFRNDAACNSTDDARASRPRDFLQGRMNRGAS